VGGGTETEKTPTCTEVVAREAVAKERGNVGKNMWESEKPSKGERFKESPIVGQHKAFLEQTVRQHTRFELKRTYLKRVLTRAEGKSIEKTVVQGGKKVGERKLRH